jgi:hypothetical protein
MNSVMVDVFTTNSSAILLAAYKHAPAITNMSPNS